VAAKLAFCSTPGRFLALAAVVRVCGECNVIVNLRITSVD
jgi:hypothetical protein